MKLAMTPTSLCGTRMRYGSGVIANPWVKQSPVVLAGPGFLVDPNSTGVSASEGRHR